MTWGRSSGPPLFSPESPDSLANFLTWGFGGIRSAVGDAPLEALLSARFIFHIPGTLSVMWSIFRWRPSIYRRIVAIEGRLQSEHDHWYYTAVGCFTCGWAGVEVALDSANAVIMAGAGGDSIQSELPVSLRPKIKFFRLAHERLAVLAEYRSEALALANRITALREMRHDMIHGFAVSVADKGRTRHVMRYGYEGARLRQRHRVYSTAEILAAAESAITLSNDLLRLADTLGKRFDPDNPIHDL